MDLMKGRYKVKVVSDPENTRVQKALFKQGCSWEYGKTDLQHIYARALYIESGILTYTSDAGSYFDCHSGQEVSVTNILGNKYKPVLVEKHVVVQDSCNNYVGIKDSYKEAEELAKNSSYAVTIFKMIEVAKVSSVRTVKKKRPKNKKK